jgi:hypothetical protein
MKLVGPMSPPVQLALSIPSTGPVPDEVVQRVHMQSAMHAKRDELIAMGVPYHVAEAHVEWAATGEGGQPVVVTEWLRQTQAQIRHEQAQERAEEKFKRFAVDAEADRLVQELFDRRIKAAIENGELVAEVDGDALSIRRSTPEVAPLTQNVVQLMIPPESAAAFATAFAEAQEARKRETDLLIETSADGRVTQVRHRAKDPRGR